MRTSLSDPSNTRVEDPGSFLPVTISSPKSGFSDSTGVVALFFVWASARDEIGCNKGVSVKRNISLVCPVVLFEECSLSLRSFRFGRGLFTPYAASSS